MSGFKWKVWIRKGMEELTSWNWAAFFVTGYWFAYRKMYSYAAIYLAAAAFIAATGATGLTFVTLGVNIAVGLLGNNMYKTYLEDKVRQAKTMPEPQKSQFLQNNGGTSTAGTVISIVAYVIGVSVLTAMFWG